jgi:hypothetical protein
MTGEYSFQVKSPFNISHIVVILFSIVHTLYLLNITRTEHQEKKRKMSRFYKEEYTHTQEKKEFNIYLFCLKN